MDRRSFLRFLGLGAAAAVAAPIIKPKAFFSFYGTGEVWKPTAPIAIKLQASSNTFEWHDIGNVFEMFTAEPPAHYTSLPRGGLLDRLVILDKDTYMQMGDPIHGVECKNLYIRLAPGSPDAILRPHQIT